LQQQKSEIPRVVAPTGFPCRNPTLLILQQKISNTARSGPLVFLAVSSRITLTFATHHRSHDLYMYFIF
jgi:hypothetical protein